MEQFGGIHAIKTLEDLDFLVSLHKKDNTDKMWSYKINKASRSEFAFDPKTKRTLTIRFDDLPPKISGIKNIVDISGDNVSTALARVFSGGKHVAKCKATIPDEDTLIKVVQYLAKK